MEFGVVIFKRIIALVTSEIKFRLTTVDNVVVLQLYENCRACCVLGWVEGNASVSVSRLLFGRKLDSGSESRFNGTSQQSRGVKWQWGQWSINGLVVDDTIFGTTLKWFRPYAQLNQNQHMKYVPWCSAACINCCDQVTSQARSSDAMNPNTILLPDSYQNFTSIGKLNLFLSELNDKF